MRFPKNIPAFLGLLGLLVIACEPEYETAPRLNAAEVQIFSAAWLSDQQIEIRGVIKDFSSKLDEDIGYLLATSEEPNYTVYTEKISSTENGYFVDTLALAAQKDKLYFVRGFVKSEGKIHYTSSLNFKHENAKTWKRLNNLPSEAGLSSGVLFKDFNDENIAFVGAKTSSLMTHWIFDYQKSRQWQAIQDFRFSQLGFGSSGASRQEMTYFTTPSGVDAFGGGFYAIENIPSQRLYQSKFWWMLYPLPGQYINMITPNVPSSFDGRLVGLSTSAGGYVLENKSMGKMWELNSFTWIERAAIPYEGEAQFVTANSGRNGLVVTEDPADPTLANGLWLYDPEKDSWQEKSPFPGKPRLEGVAFSIGQNAYYGLGKAKINLEPLKDIWQYDKEKDTWVQITEYPGLGNVKVMCVSGSNEAYLGMGYQTNIQSDFLSSTTSVTDFWLFTPSAQ
ncbi:hypothetical protein LAG90_07575 [Marinilongibacter aquaticus]|uniref:hypothetical protein n=1 Tax=Marinilongibacter aquaticus TaxID=2975157 RepID=UPI0021BD3BDD|nr:hypothetical protein [Marinilongibacter aquaticus]UBM60499.1 hypothetical protein LAG90_07575 [Marinilongibacter aquaticus]